MGMNVNFGTGVNSYAQTQKADASYSAGTSAAVNPFAQPAYDTVSFSGNQGAQQATQQEGMSTGTKVGLVAAAATVVLGIVAASKGKALNNALGKEAGLFKNIGTGLKSIFTKAGRELYKTNVTDKLDDAAKNIAQVSTSNVQDAAKKSVGAREVLKDLEKQQTTLKEQIAKATGEEAKALQTQLDDLTLKIEDAKDPTKLIQEMSSKKKAGEDISELQKRLDDIKDINIQAADRKTASLMAKQTLQGDEAYTKALNEAVELKGKLNTLTAQEASLSNQVVEKQGLLADLKDMIEKANKTGQTEAASQLEKQKTELENALKPLETQLKKLRGTGDGSISAAKKALTDVSVPIGKQYNAKRLEVFNDLQKEGSIVMGAFQATLGK